MEIAFNPFALIVAFVAVVIAISLHEMMHAYTALKLGDTTAHEEGRISLNPLSHVDPFMTIVLPIITLILLQTPILAAKPVPFNPDRVKFDEFGAALIAAAGPFTNLALAAIGAVIANIFSGNVDVYDALRIFISINVGIFIFNMVPIPPLDGSRILYAFAPDSIRNFMAQIEQFGIFIVFGLVLAVPAFSQIIVDLNTSISLFLL